jgi:transposase
MGVAKYRITPTASEREELERITRRQTLGQAIVRRARMILLADTRMANQDIAKEVGVSQVDGITLWVKRRQQRASEPIPKRLADAPRCGAPAKVGPEQVCQLIALDIMF